MSVERRSLAASKLASEEIDCHIFRFTYHGELHNM